MTFEPTNMVVCNKQGNVCPDLDSWYNGGASCFARCKKDVWDGIKTYRPNEGCETPLSCPYIKSKTD